MSELRHPQYTTQPGGLGGRSRERLSELLRRTSGTISPTEAARVLNLSPIVAAKLLARWKSQGWLARVRRGLYVPVPLESKTTNVALEDSWLVAERLFSPCYIGGWSAAEHWDLTEQLFRTLLVFTTRKLRVRNPTLRGAAFQLRTVSPESLFGLKPVWRGKVRVRVSDPARTVIDMINDPAAGGGLRSTVDVLRAYLRARDYPGADLLIQYANQLGNGAVFKRLGFLLSKYAPNERVAIGACREQMSAGTARLDPELPADKLVTTWRLWVPNGWKAPA